MVGQGSSQRHNLAHQQLERLWLVAAGRQGEVAGKDGEGVDQHFECAQHGQRALRGRTLFGAEEAGPLPDSLLVDACAGTHHAGRVELHFEHAALLHGQLAGLYLSLQVIEPCGHIGPLCELSGKEVADFGLVHLPVPDAHHGLAGMQLQCAQVVLVEVVAVELVEAEGRVRVSLPTAAQVQLLEYAGNAEAA